MGYDPDEVIHQPAPGMFERELTPDERKAMSEGIKALPPAPITHRDEHEPPPKKRRGLIGTDSIGDADMAAEIKDISKQIADLNVPLHTFEANQGIYTTEFDEPLGVSVEMDNVNSERNGEVQAVITVRRLTIGMERRLMGPVRSTISGTGGRGTLARTLAEADSRLKPYAAQLIELACINTITSEREGEPPILLRDAPRPPAADYLLDPILYDRNPTIIFGDGGSGKSYAAMIIAASLSSAKSLIPDMYVRSFKNVAYLDWEMSSWEHRGRLEYICGPLMPPMLYVACRAPITQDLHRLRRIAREHKIDYWIVDSVAPACDGEPESAEVVKNYFNALRSLGGGSLSVAHISKAQGGEYKPFGSSFWHNLARSTWFAKAQEWEDRTGIDIQMRNRKNNLGALKEPWTLSLEFGLAQMSIKKLRLVEEEA